MPRIDSLRVTHEGHTAFVATDRNPKLLKVSVVCSQGLAVGTEVRISASTFHTMAPEWRLDGVAVEEGKGRVVLGHDLPRDWMERTRGGVGPAGGGLIGRPIGEVYLCTVQVLRTLSLGAHLAFAFQLTGSRFSAVEGALQVQARWPDSMTFAPVGEAISLHNAPGAPVRLEARIKTLGEGEGKEQLVVFATDERLNPIADYRAKVSLQTDGDVAGLPAEIDIGADGRGCVAGIDLKGKKPVRIEVRDAERNLAARTNPVLASSVDECRHFFGALHFHTRLSVDGDRDPRDAYTYARDFLNLDVVAMADHAPIGTGWEECLEVNEAFHNPGRFVTLPAWESSNAYGHANLYLRTPDVDGGPWHWDPDVCPSEVAWDLDVIAVPHHTNAGQSFKKGTHRDLLSKGIYWTQYDWSRFNPRVRLVEIVQSRGNFEADAIDADWDIRQGGRGSSVRDALARGWRVGFIAGSDNHQGHPTQGEGKYVGMTCFRTMELTREAIWQAMNCRQTYATSGTPIVCDFSVNGVDAGGEVRVGEGEPAHFAARLHGTAPIAVVEIIADGRSVWQEQPNAWDVEFDGIELPTLEKTWAYYYLRLRQADGHRAWLSPVWIDRER